MDSGFVIKISALGLNNIPPLSLIRPCFFSGALLACGIVNTGVRNPADPAMALLSDYVLHDKPIIRTGAVFGLGLAYAGSNREDVVQLLLPVFADSKSSMEVVSD